MLDSIRSNLHNHMTRGVLFKLRRKASLISSAPVSDSFIEQFRLKYSESPILMAGYPKSGNTYFRFVYFNLLNQIEPFTEEKIDFKILNEVQLHTLEGENLEDPIYSAFPLFYRTHLNYIPFMNSFRLVYVYRNPFDTMVSMYYFKEVYRTWRNKKKSFKEALKVYLPEWCYHMKTYSESNCYLLSYEEMMREPFHSFNNLFKELGLQYTDEQLTTALELASFKNIRNIEEKVGSQTMTSQEKQGKKFGGLFTRSGKIGQWEEYFDEEDRKFALDQLERYELFDKFNFIFR